MYVAFLKTLCYLCIPFCVDMKTRLENDKMEEMMMCRGFSGIPVLQQSQKYVLLGSSAVLKQCGS